MIFEVLAMVAFVNQKPVLVNQLLNKKSISP